MSDDATDGSFDERGRRLPRQTGAQAPDDGDAVADLDAVRAVLADEATWAEPRDGLENDILASILAEPAPRAGSRRRHLVRRPRPRLRPPPRRRLADARARRGRSVAVVASIVAAAAVVLAIVGFASRPSSPKDESANGPVGTSSVSTPRPPVTIGPGVQADLQATDLLPGAAGTVRLDETDSGVWIRLDASGLPRRDNGVFYQAWVKTPQGLVPIGTFHTGDDVVLWSGIGIDDTDAVTVTLEENDGNQESSGQRVLVATIPHTGGTVPSTPGGSAPGTTPR